MSQIVLSVFFKPGRVHISSLMSRAETMLEHHVISELPKITVQPGHCEGWMFVIDCNEKDRLAWLAFYEGCKMCVNNRSLMVGID